MDGVTAEPGSKSSVYSYSEDWRQLFGLKSVDLEALRAACVSGELRSSRFRGLCWRVLLQCLPVDKARWTECLAQSRNAYAALRKRTIVNPRSCVDDNTLAVNNPLSLEVESPWQKYFSDVELRACVDQDVERTFPELEYFQSDSTRTLMKDILFVYARENPEIAYKQGMHEVLGPLLFVLFYDQQAYLHSAEHDALSAVQADERKLMAAVANADFLEHDAFQLFSQMMRIIQPWYSCGADDGGRRVVGRPFQRAQDAAPGSALVCKLNWIGDTLLRHADAKLYAHLEQLEIAPQIYGIRWLRLLFGREFPIQDLLQLWDAVFADGAPFLLVDFIFVTMLIIIRHLLLASDYTGCLHYLMRYPPAVDVRCLLALALHLKDPQRFSKPKAYAFMNFSHITVAGRPHPNAWRNERVGVSAVDAKSASSIGRSLEKTGTRVLDSISRVSTIVADSFKEPPPTIAAASPAKVPSLRNSPSRLRQTDSPVALNRVQSSSRRLVAAENGIVDAVALLQEQISCLQVRLNELDQQNRYYADKVGACIDVVQAQLAELTAPPDCDAYRSLHDLRRICLLLREPERPSVVEVGADPARAMSPAQPPTPLADHWSLVTHLRAENELQDMRSPSCS